MSLPQTFPIRLAVTTEQKPLESLQRRASLANPDDRAALLAHPEVIALPVAQIESGCVSVAELDTAIAGFAVILPRPDGNSKVDGLFVEPAHWRRGIGRALVEHCCTVAQAAGASALHVVGHPHAESFYHSCRFATIGPTSTRFGPGLLMQRSL